jgi:hypothetical protein
MQGAWATWCMPVVIASSLVTPLALCVVAYYVTQIIGFGALAVVDSILLALVRPLIACVDLAAAIMTATTRRSVATLAYLTDALDRRANWVATFSEPALAMLANALHRGYAGKKRCPTRATVCHATVC